MQKLPELLISGILLFLSALIMSPFVALVYVVTCVRSYRQFGDFTTLGKIWDYAYKHPPFPMTDNGAIKKYMIDLQRFNVDGIKI